MLTEMFNCICVSEMVLVDFKLAPLRCGTDRYLAVCCALAGAALLTEEKEVSCAVN